MDNETDMVITPEIVPVDENNTNPVAAAVVTGLALVGAFKIASFVAGKVPFRIVRTSKDVETPEVPATPTPVVAE